MFINCLFIMVEIFDDENKWRYSYYEEGREEDNRDVDISRSEIVR